MKKIYNISGFDCPNCAAKAETYLSKQDNVKSVRLDFARNKLYIDYRKEAWSLEELSSVISKVESDPLNISEYSEGNANISNKIFDKKMYFLLIRILVSVLTALTCTFLLAKPELNIFRYLLYIFAVVFIGYDIFYKVIVHIKNKANILDHFLLISIAALGSLIIATISLIEKENVIHGNIALDDSMEALMVITLFQIGSVIEQVATNKSKSAVMAAVQLRVETASLLTKEGVKNVKPASLNVGDVIIVQAGEIIPIDGVIIDGEGYIDTSSLTGEYIPVQVVKNLEVFSGCLLKSGSIKLKVNKKYSDSTINKIINLICEGGEKKSKADYFIAKFAKYYTPIVVLLAILVGLIGSIISKNPALWIHTGLEILVIGCPCAIVISVPLAYFASIGLASKNGIVIKGSNFLDELTNMGLLITDKTGTLTHGSFSIQEINPLGLEKEEFLNYLYAAECLSSHPIGKAICHGLDLKKIKGEQKNFKEISGSGVISEWKNKMILAGNDKLMKQYKIQYNPVEKNGVVIYLAIDEKYVGYVVISDQIKEDAQPMVGLLHKRGIEIVLLTGDSEDNAKEVCEKLLIDRWYANLLPEDKTRILEDEMSRTDKAVAFIGDGINDAPSIIRSDIGIAMGGIGSDVAVENADVVVMNDDPAKVNEAIKVAEIAKATSIFNIAFALVIKFVVFVLSLVFSILKINNDFMMYIAILSDTGLTVLLIINSLLILSRKVK